MDGIERALSKWKGLFEAAGLKLVNIWEAKHERYIGSRYILVMRDI